MADPKIILTAVDQTKAAFESVKTGLTGIQTKAVAVTGVLGALSTGAALVSMIGGLHDAIDKWDELGKAAQRAGFQSAQGIAEFQFAAKLAGVDSAGFETAIGKLSEKMAAVAGGSEAAGDIFKTMGVKIKDAAGNLRGTEDVVTDLAKAFSAWKDGPEKTALALELFGKSGKQLIPLLNGGADGLDKMRELFRQLHGVLNEQTNKSAEQFNDNLTKLEASAGGLKRQMAENLLPGLIQITDAMVEQAKKGSTLLTIWAGLKEIGKLAIGVDPVASKKAQLDLLEESLAKGGDSGGKLQAKINTLRGELFNTPEIQKSAAALEASFYGGDIKERAPVNKAKPPPKPESSYAAINKLVMERLSLQADELRAGRELTEAEKFEVKALEDLRSSKVKLSAAEQKNIQDKLANLKVQEALVDAQRREKKTNEEYAASLAKPFEDEQKAIEAFADAQKKRSRDQEATASKALEQIEFETSLIGLNNQQREVAIALHELENQGIRQGTVAFDTYAAAIQQAAANRGALNEAVDNFKNMWESIDSTAHDVWTNIWHGGSDVFKRLGQTLKASVLDVLYQMVVKKWIFNIFANVAGAGGQVTNAVGNGVLQGTTSSFIGGSSILGGGSLLGAGAGATMSNGLISGFGANMGNIATLFEGGSYMTALSAAAPYLAIGLAAISMLSGAFKGETRSGGQYSNAGFLQGPSGGEINGDQVRSTITATIGSINDTLKGLGSTATLGNLQSGFESSERGKGFAYAGGQLSTGQIFGQGVGGRGFENRRGSMSPEEAAAAFGEELKQATLQALQAADVPGKLGEYLKSLGDIDKLSGGALDDAINRIQKALTEKQQLEAKLYDLTATDAEKLAKARGDERAAIDESNQALLDHVYALQDEKAASEAAAQAAQELAQKQQAILNERLGLEQQLLQLQGNTAELRNRERAALDESNRALYDQINAIKDQAAAHDQQQQAIADARDRAQSDLMSAYQRESSALQGVIDKHRAYATQLRQVRDEMFTGEDAPMSPAGRTSEALRQYNEIFAKAVGGDLDAIGRLQAAGTTYLAALKDSAPTKADFNLGFGRVAAGLTMTASASDAAATAAQSQLNVMTGQLTALGLLKDVTQQGFSDLLAAYTGRAGGGGGGGALSAGDAAYIAKHDDPMFFDPFRDTADGRALSGLQPGQAVTFGSLALPSWRARAGGGFTTPGLTMVGERGQEVVDMATPGRVYNAEQTRGMFGSQSALLDEVRAMRAEMAMLRAASEATATHAYETRKNTTEMKDRGVYALNSPDGEALVTTV